MAKRQRGSKLTVLALVVACGCICHWFWAPPQTFMQPNAGQQHNAAMLGSLVPLMAALPAEAAGDPGPLAGSSICNNLVGLSLVAPLCNTIWLADPVYQFPLFGVIIASIVLPLQLLIPALQPDEDLRN